MRVSDCDTDRSLMTAIVGDRLQVNKRKEDNFINVQTIHHGLQYPSLYQQSCTTLCFFTHRLVLTPNRSDVY